MLSFHCELAATLCDELIVVSGWAPGGAGKGLRIRVHGQDGSQDLTDSVIRYYRGDVTANMRESGVSLDAPPDSGVMALAPVRFPLKQGASYSLLVESDAAPAQSVPLGRLTAADLEGVVEHLYLRFPYFLRCYSKNSLALESPQAASLLDKYLEKYPHGIESGCQHRLVDPSGMMGVSVEVSCVLQRAGGRVLVVSGHVASSMAHRPAMSWMTVPEPGPDWFSLETPEKEAQKLGEHGLSEVRRFVGVLPLARLGSASRVAIVRVISGPSSIEFAVPITPPVALADFVAKLGTIGTTAVVERLAQDSADGIAADVARHLEVSSVMLRPPALETTVVRPEDMSVTSTSGSPINAAVDYAFLATENSIVTLGWALTPPGRVVELACHDIGGRVCSRKKVTRWMQRRDVAEVCRGVGIPLSNEHVGFCTLFEGLDLADFRGAGDRLYFSVENDDSVRCRFRPWKVEVNSGDWAAMLGKILTQLKDHDPERWLPELAPVLSRVWSGRPPRSQSVEVHTFGSQPARPTVSIIVPLFGRVDLMEYQLACFAGDRDVSSAELIYFLDDPRHADTTLDIAQRCHRIFGVPFRLLLTEDNLGYAGANNKAVAHARGEVVLLMNSDVMPKSTGWLSRMLDTFRALPDVGALGARLLFEDGSIQHVGIAFEPRRGRRQTIWLNEHPFKGYPTGLVPKRGVERVPAVTAACMMVSRTAFESNGGLSEDYIYADFEDSDFCLKLSKKGLHSYIAHDVELYHLERQSVPALGEGTWRNALVLVNAWIHTKRWGSVLAQLEGRSS